LANVAEKNILILVEEKKNNMIPNVAEKNILILVEEKKKSNSEFLSYNQIMYPMINF
jgi:hypothetical protein